MNINTVLFKSFCFCCYNIALCRSFNSCTLKLISSVHDGAENAGPEIAGPEKCRKMPDQIALPENAGLKMHAGLKMQERKMQDLELQDQNADIEIGDLK